jgi:hypothetical protein
MTDDQKIEAVENALDGQLTAEQLRRAIRNARQAAREDCETRTDSNTYFQIFKLDEVYEDWWPQHLRDLQACGMWGAMSNKSGNGFAWILNWPIKWGTAPDIRNGEGMPESDAELFALLREHDIPALAPAALKLETLLLGAGVRIIDPPQRKFPYYRGQP